MPRKKPLLDQCPNTPPRRRSTRRRLSKSPTKLQIQHDTKTQLPPSSPLSGTSESLYGDIGYQSPVPISIPSAAPEVARASLSNKAKGKGKEVVSATCLPPTETPSMPSTLNHGTRHSSPHNTQAADDQGKSSQSSRLSPPTSSPRRASQSPSNVQRQVDHELGESSQSSRLSTPPPEDPINPSSPLSSPPNFAPVKKTRKREKKASTKELPNLTNNTTAPSKRLKPKQKKGRSRSPSSSISTRSGSDDAAGSDIPDIGLPMKDTWENLYANLGDVPEKGVEEEKPLEPKAVAPVRKPTKLPKGVKIGDTCLFEYRSSHWLAILLKFEPGLTLDSDRYTLNVRDLGVRITKRANVCFLTDEKVKTMKGVGGLKQGVVDPDQYRSTAFVRAATPPLTNNNDKTPFANRTRQEQIYLLRPHLDRVIKDEYTPALARIDAFYREEQLERLTGDYPEAELSNLFEPEIRRWLLRPMADVIPDQSRRPKGSDRFEYLQDGKKSEFILSILIPETLIQLEILLHGQDPKLLAESEIVQYQKAVKRLRKRGCQADPWEIPLYTAQEAMGLFKRPKTREERERELEATGKWYITFGGSERLARKVNYAE